MLDKEGLECLRHQEKNENESCKKFLNKNWPKPNNFSVSCDVTPQNLGDEI